MTPSFSLFQSLFYWKLLSYRCSLLTWLNQFRGFNPCFIGNCSHTTVTPLLSSTLMLVSILVLLETALIPETGIKLSLFKFSFQSLFYWKLLSYNTMQLLNNNNYIRFNPCFIGNCSHTPKYRRDFRCFAGFNPCFIGNCSHTKRNGEKMKKKEEFQSLFYWKLLSYNPRGIKRADFERCFNPCFIGNCSHTRILIIQKGG